MTGWVKIEKALTESIKFRRIVRALKQSNALCGATNSDDSLYVTLAIGALVKLWQYADTHISDDNTIAATFDEIDDLVGVKGFASAMPADWLVVVDPNNVQLPNFLEHNGTSAKQRKDTAKRQAAYRHRHVKRNVTRESRVTNASNDARPDQTRPDKTRPEDTQSARARGIPKVSRGSFELIAKLRECYPRGLYRDNDWLAAERAVCDLLDQGEKFAELVASASAYAMQQAAKGSTGTQFVLSPAKFFVNGTWRGPFPLPATKAEAAQDANLRASDAWLGGAHVAG